MRYSRIGRTLFLSPTPMSGDSATAEYFLECRYTPRFCLGWTPLTASEVTSSRVFSDGSCRRSDIAFPATYCDRRSPYFEMTVKGRIALALPKALRQVATVTREVATLDVALPNALRQVATFAVVTNTRCDR